MKPRNLNSVLYLLLLAAMTIYAAQSPVQHFDRQLYADAIQAAHGSMALSFPEQIPLYSVKPLFVMLASAVGIRAVVCLSFLGLGLVVWEWSGRATLMSALFMGSYVVLGTARLGTPDTMQSFLLVLGAWLVLERGKFLGLLPLLCAVWTRSDALILLTLVLLAGVWREKIKAVDAAVGLALAILSWFAISRYGYSYQYLLHSTMKTSYIRGLLLQATKSNLTMLFPYAMLALAAKTDPLVWIGALGYSAHMLLFPNAEERYALPFISLIAVAFIRKFAFKESNSHADVVSETKHMLVRA